MGASERGFGLWARGRRWLQVSGFGSRFRAAHLHEAVRVLDPLHDPRDPLPVHRHSDDRVRVLVTRHVHQPSQRRLVHIVLPQARAQGWPGRREPSLVPFADRLHASG